MPRIRTLKPDIWQDEKVGALQPLARLMWIGLITQADDDGRLWYRPRILRVAIFPYDDKIKDRDIESLIGELAKACMVVIYKTQNDHNALQIKNWQAHQRINRKTDSSIPAPDDSMIIHGGLIEDSLTEGRGKGGDMDMDMEREKDTSNEFDGDFDSWWNLYPRKVGKVKSRNSYVNLRKSEIPAELLVDARDAYIKELQENKVETRFVMHPEKFLGINRYFEDYASMEGWKED